MTRLASDIREADKPIYCSACFNQQHVRHIDFDAACDRGYGNEESVKIVMDDLILCENCVKEGAKLLGMRDAGETEATLSVLETENLELRKRTEKAERYAETMEDALAQKSIRLDHRKKPRERQAA